MSRVTFAPTAIQSWSSLPRWAQTRYDRCFDLLASNTRRPRIELDIHQLFGYLNVWTLRIPPYRGVYAVEGIEVVMIVFGHRDSVYSQLHRLIPPTRALVSKATLSKRR
jgi:mRNA-degrading endonuclease RelE of RelBE toxin-antitoxin system